MTHQNQVMHILAFDSPDNCLNALLRQHAAGVTTGIGAMRGKIHGEYLVYFGAGGKPGRMLHRSICPGLVNKCSPGS